MTFINTLGRTSTRPARTALRLRDMISLRRQRAALARLDKEMLDDIGVSVREASTESRRAAWDVPAHWRG